MGIHPPSRRALGAFASIIPMMTDSVYTPPRWWRILGTATRPLARILWPARTEGWARSTHPTTWLHAASVGEVKGLLRLAEALEGVPLTLTATTSSGLARLRRERPDLDSFLLPWDDSASVDLFLTSRRIERAVFFEAEAWPTAFGRLSARHTPLAMVAVRCSSTSHKRWKRLSLPFPGWTKSVSIAWADGPASALEGLGFPDARDGASLKWAGAPTARPKIVPGRIAALSYHAKDLLRLRRLVRSHPGKAWLWFPRRISLRTLSRLLARSLGLEIVPPESLPGPGEVWISPRLGLVETRLPGCESAWVAPGHDREEALRLGVPALLCAPIIPGKAGRTPEETLREVLDWVGRQPTDCTDKPDPDPNNPRQYQCRNVPGHLF